MSSFFKELCFITSFAYHDTALMYHDISDILTKCRFRQKRNVWADCHAESKAFSHFLGLGTLSWL